MINHTLSLDMRKQLGRMPPRLAMRRGESQTQKITATITDDGAAYVPTYQSARLCLLHADGTWARCAATVSGSTVAATLASDMLNGAGRCRLAYFEFYSSNGYSETTENIELVILGNVDTSGEAAKDYSDEMDALYEKMSAFLSQAEGAEKARVANENMRASNENRRVSNETARASAEKARESACASAVSNADMATADANTAAALAAAAAARLGDYYFKQESDGVHVYKKEV